jgi:hypothetical protein
MQLIARRAIGVSENRRKLYGVGFGIASLSGPYESKIDGSAEVRRIFANRASDSPLAAEFKDTPATRRQAPRTTSVIFMMISLAAPASLGRSRRFELLCVPLCPLW